MTTIPAPIILFADEKAANYLVAGVPAAARAIMAIEAPQPGEPVYVAVPGGWQPTALCRTEAARLAPGTNWVAIDSSGRANPELVSGTSLQASARTTSRETGIDIAALKAEARAILSNSGKAGDGIVSRHINRPISRAISWVVLKWSGIRPWHATLAVAVIAAAMLSFLLFGGSSGLLAGAVLFQLASIVDGVDGEIARAKLQTSDMGATIDNATDVLTNIGFIGGVSYNLYSSGAQMAGTVGAASVTVMALGGMMALFQSRRDGGAFTYDALKAHFLTPPSRLKQWFAYFIMRDLYAFVALIAILIGAAIPAIFVFALGAHIWFAILCWTMASSMSRN